MLPFLVAISFQAALQPISPTRDAFMAALAAGDGAAAQAMLSSDATVMHEESGEPVESTAAAIATFLKGCEGSILLDVGWDDPTAMAFNGGWSCGERGETEMSVWLQDDRVVWVQLRKLEPAAPPAQ